MFAINRLHVKANKKEAKAIVNDLQYGSWSVIDNHQWLFIRSLSIRAKKITLRQQASEETNKAIQQAVDGRLSSAVHANAVRFTSYPEMLAFLLRDLANGNAACVWYWSRWHYLLSETKSLAVQRLLWESREHIAAIIQQLNKHQLLNTVWPHLGAAAAREILKELLDQAVLMSESNASPTLTVAESLAVNAIKTNFLNRLTLVYSWQQALTNTMENDERCQLAAIITGLQLCPVLTQRHPNLVVRVFCQLLISVTNPRKRFIAPTDQIAAAVTVDNQLVKESQLKVDHDIAVNNQANRESTKALQPIANAKSKQTSKDNALKLPQTSIPKEKSHASSKTSVASGESIWKTTPEPNHQSNQTTSTDIINGEESSRETVSELFDPLFITTHGGLFYLINAIRDSSCQKLLLNEQAHAVNSGWLWLYQLSKALEVDPDLSLTQFIAEQCGFDSLQQLQNLAPLKSVQQVAALLAARYSHNEIWNQQLIKVPAQVVATASHVDVYYPLSCVNLAIRLAGLDINPGWIPWLGRVVSFHYQHQQNESLSDPSLSAPTQY